MEDKLNEAPGGSWITMKGKGHCDMELLAIGYKYDSKCALKFAATADAGSTQAGIPYVMKFCDSYNNLCIHKVDRPEIVSQFFGDSNCIDSHNHVRQFEFALKKRWFAWDPLFCLHTTLVGMIVTEVWRLSQYHKLISNAKDEDRKNAMMINKFTSVLENHLLKIEMSYETKSNPLLSPIMASISSWRVSPLSSDESADSYFAREEYTDAEGKYQGPSLLPMTEQKSGKKHHRQHHCRWFKVKYGKLYCTIWTCHTSDNPFFMPPGNNDGRD
jgi:hypothetical protein